MVVINFETLEIVKYLEQPKNVDLAKSHNNSKVRIM